MTSRASTSAGDGVGRNSTAMVALLPDGSWNEAELTETFTGLALTASPTPPPQPLTPAARTRRTAKAEIVRIPFHNGAGSRKVTPALVAIPRRRALPRTQPPARAGPGRRGRPRPGLCASA